MMESELVERLAKVLSNAQSVGKWDELDPDNQATIRRSIVAVLADLRVAITEPWTRGDILQIDPQSPNGRRGQFVIASVVHSWGAQGALALITPDPGLHRVVDTGLAFIRVEYGEARKVGRVRWEPEGL